MANPHSALCTRKVRKTPAAMKETVLVRVDKVPLRLKYLPRRWSGTTSAIILPQTGEVRDAEIE